MQRICENEKCTGCTACKSICPKKCIRMEPDAYGFFHPEINVNECVDCGLCAKTCPVNNEPELKEPIKTLAAINKNQHDYETATSGGIATMVTRFFVENGGVVYGAAMLPECHVRHIRIDSAKDVDKIKGSKYVQSDLENTFTSVREDLRAGRQVLFIGTPCQAAGLRKFVGREGSNLYVCDIVCHGVPSEEYLRRHLSGVADMTEVKTVSFREKEGFYLSADGLSGKLYRRRNYRDVYYLGFLKGLFYRSSCYTCQYATSKRVGDLTFGDFWGFDRTKGDFPAKTSHGLSCVLVNTKKGEEIMNACADKMLFMERETSEAVAGNKQLRNPSRKHKNYVRFQKLYLKYGFKKAAEKTLVKERMIYGLLDLMGR